MSIVITLQPELDSLNAVYRPIVYRCAARISGATSLVYVPPVVYCDIYVNTIYYKTLSKTQYDTNNGFEPVFEFDIQDAIQEIMEYNLPEIDGSNVLEFTNTIKKVSVKFRNAKYDSNGFIASEQTEPIQGTSNSDPVSGGGVESYLCYVVNATIQHEEEQTFPLYLDSYKTGAWDDEDLPMTRRPKIMKLCRTDSSYFPIVTAKDIECLFLYYKLKGDIDFRVEHYCYPAETLNKLIITDVVKTTGSNFNIFFASNFTLSLIKAQVSIDGVNWSVQTTSPNLNSPYSRIISLGTNFYVRLSDTNGSIINYSNVYHYIENSSTPPGNGEENPDLDPLVNYNIINLNKNTTSSNACNISGANAQTKYIDSNNFSSASKLFNDIHGNSYASVGWYTNGGISRHWSGTSFDDIIVC